MTGGSERETRAVRPSLTSCFPLALIVVFCKRRSVWPSEECHVFLLTHRDIYVNVGGNRFLGTYRDQNGALFDQLQGYGLELSWRIPAAGMNGKRYVGLGGVGHLWGHKDACHCPHLSRNGPNRPLDLGPAFHVLESQVPSAPNRTHAKRCGVMAEGGNLPAERSRRTGHGGKTVLLRRVLPLRPAPPR